MKIDTTHTIANGWDIDRSKGDSGHPGISMVKDESNGQAKDSLQDYNYKAISDSAVEVVGSIEGHSNFLGGTNANFRRLYKAFKRRQKPKDPADLPKVTTKFLITSRGLCVCLGNLTAEMMPITKGLGESMVDTRTINIPPQLLTSETSPLPPSPAFNEILRDVQFAMSTSWRLPTRQAYGEVGFLESDYFKDQIREALSEKDLKAPLSELGVLPDGMIELLGKSCTVDEALAMDLSTFAEKTKLSVPEAIKERNKLLGRK